MLVLSTCRVGPSASRLARPAGIRPCQRLVCRPEFARAFRMSQRRQAQTSDRCTLAQKKEPSTGGARVESRQHESPTNARGRLGKDTGLKLPSRSMRKQPAHLSPTEVFPERLLIYHAGTARTSVLAVIKLTTVFALAFFCTVAGPTYFSSGEPLWKGVARAFLLRNVLYKVGMKLTRPNDSYGRRRRALCLCGLHYASVRGHHSRPPAALRPRLAADAGALGQDGLIVYFPR